MTPTPTPDPLGEALFLHLISPVLEEGEFVAAVTSPQLVIEGRTRIDAAVTIDDTFMEVDEEGRFKLTVTLPEGITAFEIVASVATGEEQSFILIVTFEPPAEGG